jgi:hypothetical protein
LFWTIPIPKSAIKASAGSGIGRYSMQNVALPDFHDFLNAISPSPETRPGHVSFDVHWPGDGDRQTIRDDTFNFTGTYISGTVSIQFTATDDSTGITYTSDSAQQTTVSGGIGHERNGIFYS